MFGDELPTVSAPTFDQPTNDTADIPIVGDILSAGGILLSVLNTVWEVVTLLVAFLTWDIDSLPGVFRFFGVVATIGTLAWSIVEIIRGT